MEPIETTLATIQDKLTVRVAFPVTDSSEKIRINCIYLASTPPEFKLYFSPDTLPVHRIDRHQKCIVLFDVSSKNISMTADIKDIENDQIVHLVAREIVNHEQLRDYFRIDISTPVIASCLIPQDLGYELDHWRLSGETIDVSGSGILAAFPQPLDQTKSVRIDLVLPVADGYVVKATAKVIRIRQINENRYHVAFRFDKITSEDRDRIVGCCFEIQRRHLRLKVQVKDF